jgi:hypothetical protein
MPQKHPRYVKALEERYVCDTIKIQEGSADPLCGAGAGQSVLHVGGACPAQRSLLALKPFKDQTDLRLIDAKSGQAWSCCWLGGRAQHNRFTIAPCFGPNSTRGTKPSQLTCWPWHDDGLDQRFSRACAPGDHLCHVNPHSQAERFTDP